MKSILFLLMFWVCCPLLIGQTTPPRAGQAGNLTTDSPLVVELGSVKEGASDAVLTLGAVGVGAASEITLTITNDSPKAIQLDVFSLGYGALAVWEPADQVPSTRTSLPPGGHRYLRIRLVTFNDQKLYPSILFMRNWQEIGHVDIVFAPVDRPSITEYKFNSQDWYTSGMGKEAAHYRFCTPAPPPVFTIAKATPRLWESPGDKDDPRGCHSWAACDPDTPKPGEGACFAPWVQGHSEGGSHAKDRTVQFQFAITVEYQPVLPVWTLTSSKELLKKSAETKQQVNPSP